jgi:hypothetical protein
MPQIFKSLHPRGGPRRGRYLGRAPASDARYVPPAALPDSEWFLSHRDREFRLRPMLPGDWRYIVEPAALSHPGPFIAVVRRIGSAFLSFSVPVEETRDWPDGDDEAGLAKLWGASLAELQQRVMEEEES